MNQDELRQLEDQCIQECAPPCSTACPVHVDVRAILTEITRGDFTAGLKLYKKAVPFPGIISRICDQPCQSVCHRRDLGDAIALRSLERICADLGDLSNEKQRPLPKRGGRVVVIGGGISGLTAAYDLARKGYAVTIVEAGDQLGGSLWKADRDYLPAPVIENDFAAVLKLGVEVEYNTPVQTEALHALRREYDAVYLAIGPHTEEHFGLELDEYQTIKVDPVTFATSLEGVYAGGGLRWGQEMRSSITSISEGRRAGISIDRYLQKVSLTASRINEGPYTTCLYTNLAGIESRPQIEMQHPDGYEWHEAIQEAKRCLQCECLECVKACAYLKHFERYPRRYVREIYNNLSIVKGTRYANTLINSCSLCGLCGEICPENLDMGAVNLNARREMVAQNRMPASAHDFALRDMAFSNSDQFKLARHHPGTAVSDYVFFPGCQLSASAPDQVEKVYTYLTTNLSAKTGLLLGCCGAPANWSGQSDLFNNTLADWRAQLQTMGQPKVVLACSSCYQIFKTHLPEVEIVSLWQIFEQHGLPPTATMTPRTVAIHDPCTTRYENALQDSVRHLVQQTGCSIEELPLSQERTTCCSYGGNMWLANRELAQQTAARRAAENAADYVTYCAMCRDFLAAQGKRTWHILDLIYGPVTDDGAARRGPGYSQRHENRARLKRHLLQTLWGESMAEPSAFASIKLIIGDEVQARLEDRLILVEDLQRVIEYAERTGRKLVNPGTGRSLASYRPTSVTYWVEYLPGADGFTIFNAYSHRMEILGGTQP